MNRRIRCARCLGPSPMSSRGIGLARSKRACKSPSRGTVRTLRTSCSPEGDEVGEHRCPSGARAPWGLGRGCRRTLPRPQDAVVPARTVHRNRQGLVRARPGPCLCVFRFSSWREVGASPRTSASRRIGKRSSRAIGFQESVVRMGDLASLPAYFSCRVSLRSPARARPSRWRRNA